MKLSLSVHNEKQLQKVYQNIRKLRSMFGFSQQYMADELGITQKHYSQIENGKVDISLKLFIKITELLNVTPSALLGFSEEKVFNNINHINDYTTFSQYNAIDVNEIKKLYERLLLEKDKVIEQQKQLIDKFVTTNGLVHKK